MPTDHVVCGVSYRRYEDGRVSILEAGGAEKFPTLSSAAAPQVSKIWSKYGPVMTKLAREFGIPVAYVVGFMTIESSGNENACAPCTKTYTDKEGVEHQWCSFAPNCAPAGHKQCCAYGLLGVIHSNVVKWTDGKYAGQDLLGNPELAIRVGLHVFMDNWKRSGDLLTAVKWYNGGKACQGGGLFRMGGQVGANYVDRFVQACNTFVGMGLAPSAAASLGSGGGLVIAAAAAAVAWMVATKTKPGRRFVRYTSRAAVRPV